MRNAFREGATFIEDAWYLYTNLTLAIDSHLTDVKADIGVIETLVDAIYDYITDYYIDITNIATISSSSNLAAIYTRSKASALKEFYYSSYSYLTPTISDLLSYT